MQGIDAIQNKMESKLISSINNDTAENGYIFSVTMKSRVIGIPIPMTGWNHYGRPVLVKVTAGIRVLR